MSKLPTITLTRVNFKRKSNSQDFDQGDENRTSSCSRFKIQKPMIFTPTFLDAIDTDIFYYHITSDDCNSGLYGQTTFVNLYFKKVFQILGTTLISMRFKTYKESQKILRKGLRKLNDIGRQGWEEGWALFIHRIVMTSLTAYGFSPSKELKLFAKNSSTMNRKQNNFQMRGIKKEMMITKIMMLEMADVLVIEECTWMDVANKLSTYENLFSKLIATVQCDYLILHTQSLPRETLEFMGDSLYQMKKVHAQMRLEMTRFKPTMIVNKGYVPTIQSVPKYVETKMAQLTHKIHRMEYHYFRALAKSPFDIRPNSMICCPKGGPGFYCECRDVSDSDNDTDDSDMNPYSPPRCVTTLPSN
jgi:hypothetical protein